MPYQDPSTVLRFSLEKTDSTCQVKGLMTGYRECGCRLVRVELSPALQEEVNRAGVELRNGDLLCAAGTICGIKNGARLQRLLGLLR